RLSAPAERALPRHRGAGVARWPGVHRGVGRDHLSGRRAAVWRRGDSACARARGPAETRVRAAGSEGRAGVRRDGGDRVAAGAVEPAVRDSAAAHSVDSLGAAIARVEQDSAADQQVLDSLHRVLPHPDSTRARSDSAAPPPVKGEEVEREAVRLFDKEGKALVGAAPSPEPTFDIDVSSFAMNRRVLQYLEFFRVDSRDRFVIWLGRLARYEGMIRDRLRAKRLPEDLVYLTLVESGLSNTAVSRAKAVGMWQFMASTGRLYGLTVDPWVDERRDPFKATEAAVNYLAD